jgi:site-specific recombinase XerC
LQNTKLKKNEHQNEDILFLLRMGKKISMEQVTKTKVEAETEGMTNQRLPHMGSIPYTTTKNRHYCEYQQKHTDRSLI